MIRHSGRVVGVDAGRVEANFGGDERLREEQKSNDDRSCSWPPVSPRRPHARKRMSVWPDRQRRGHAPGRCTRRPVARFERRQRHHPSRAAPHLPTGCRPRVPRAFGRPDGFTGSFLGCRQARRPRRVHAARRAHPTRCLPRRSAARIPGATRCSGIPPMPERSTTSATTTPISVADPWRDPGAAASLTGPALARPQPATVGRAHRQARCARRAVRREGLLPRPGACSRRSRWRSASSAVGWVAKPPRSSRPSRRPRSRCRPTAVSRLKAASLRWRPRVAIPWSPSRRRATKRVRRARVSSSTAAATSSPTTT